MYTLPSQFRKNSMGNIIQAPNRTMSKSEQDTCNTKTAFCWTHWPRDWKSWFMICISFVLDPQPEWLYMATTYFKAYLSIIKKLLGYGLDGQGILVQLPAQTRKFSLHQSIQIGSGAHLASHTTSPMESWARSKWPGCGTDSPPSSAKINNLWNYTPNHTCFHGVAP